MDSTSSSADCDSVPFLFEPLPVVPFCLFGDKNPFGLDAVGEACS